MTQTTRKSLITSKYNELITELSLFVDTSIFPSLEDIDCADLIFYFNLTFPPNQTGDYRQNLLDVIEVNDIEYTDEQFEKAYEIIRKYLLWFRMLR